MIELSNPADVSRRTFLKVGVTAGAAATALPMGISADEKPAEPRTSLPRRVLGRTGEQVTMLNLGTAQGGINSRLLNFAYGAGVRYIDTADCYGDGAERSVGAWLADTDRRKEFHLVTKDHPRTPDHWVSMVDARLAALRTDYIDLFFIHNLAPEYHGVVRPDVRAIPKATAWAKAAEKLKTSGKVRFVGFSTHTELPMRIELLKSAAGGGWVDAIMVAYDPKLVRENAEFNKALDACHKAGIGLICMKEMRAVAHAPKFLPEFKEMGLTPHQAVLHAVWSDERIASICSSMTNLNIVKENTAAARSFKPMDNREMGAVIELYERYASGFCNGCDGRCGRAAGTEAALNDITRALSYYECDGARDEARRLYASLTPGQRDWHGADLGAASAACVSQLDFASLLQRAETKLA